MTGVRINMAAIKMPATVPISNSSDRFVLWPPLVIPDFFCAIESIMIDA